MLYPLPDVFFCETCSFLGPEVSEVMPSVDERTDEEGVNAEVLWSVDIYVGYVVVTEDPEVAVLGVAVAIELEMVEELLVGVVTLAVAVTTAFDDGPPILNIRIFDF